MDNIAIPTIKQILVLTQFCRKVQIPFDVYTFTTKEYYQNPFEKAGEVCYNHINLCHVLTSSAKKSEIDTDMFNLFCQGYQQSSYCGADVPRSSYLAMGGTPLDNTLLFVPQIIREFQSKTKSQKVSFVCITDGDSAPITFLKERTRYDGKTDINMTACYYERTLIRSNRGCFDIGVSTEHTGNIAKWLTEEIPGVSVTHIFLGGLGASSSYLRRYDSQIDDKLFRKEDGICMTNKFWGVICALNPKSFLDSDSELQCEDGANKAEVKKALKKFLGKKQSSKKLLSTLVSQFA
jgi:hypothetical protein